MTDEDVERIVAQIRRQQDEDIETFEETDSNITADMYMR